MVGSTDFFGAASESERSACRPVPGRLGSQHIITIHIDDDDFMSGAIQDWKCPAGQLPPLNPAEPTRCRAKTSENFFYTFGDYTDAWSPTLSWVNIRMPISFTAGQRGRMSLRINASGAPRVMLDEGADYRLSILERDHAVVVGGKFLGRPWLDMAEVKVDSPIALYREYQAPI
jgi:hypothetical protein